MKTSSSAILAGVIILAVGLVLIICNSLIKETGIIALGGILFMLSGIVNAVLYLTAKDAEGKPRNKGLSLVFGWVVCVASILLGISMLVFDETFTKLVPLFFGLLIFLGALLQFYVLLWGTRPVVMPKWLYAVPSLMMIAALVIFFAQLEGRALMSVTGASFVVFGIGGFIEGFIVRRVTPAESANSKTEKSGKEIKSLDE